jgi:hypothetical protein
MLTSILAWAHLLSPRYTSTPQGSKLSSAPFSFPALGFIYSAPAVLLRFSQAMLIETIQIPAYATTKFLVTSSRAVLNYN